MCPEIELFSYLGPAEKVKSPVSIRLMKGFYDLCARLFMDFGKNPCT
jgi:hypothetical protein